MVAFFAAKSQMRHPGRGYCVHYIGNFRVRKGGGTRFIEAPK